MRSNHRNNFNNQNNFNNRTPISSEYIENENFQRPMNNGRDNSNFNNRTPFLSEYIDNENFPQRPAMNDGQGRYIDERYVVRNIT